MKNSNNLLNKFLSWVVYWIILSYLWIFFTLVMRCENIVTLCIFICSCILAVIFTQKLENKLNKEDQLNYERKKKKNQKG